MTNIANPNIPMINRDYAANHTQRHKKGFFTSDQYISFSGSFDRSSNRFTYASNENNTFSIYTYDLNTDLKQRLTNDDGMDFSPTFSNDGLNIAYTSNSDGDFDIYMMDENGNNKINISNNNFTCIEPKFSPDNKSIIYLSRSVPGGVVQTHISDIYGNNKRIIAENLGHTHKAFFAGNGKIVLTIDKDIYIANKEGTDIIKLTNSSTDVSYYANDSFK